MDLFGAVSDLELARAVPGLYLGTQGWSYSSWVGPFYPQGTRPAEFISVYAGHFRSVEIDSTFYASPRDSLVDHWNRSTPEGFVFSAKFPKTITHEKRLKDCSAETDSFLDAMSRLGGKLGPLLLQFDYTFRADQLERLESFLKTLPTEFRYAVEIRHRGWLKEERFFDLLARYRVAFVLADYAYTPPLDRATSDFVYLRWLGNRKDVADDQYEKVILERSGDLAHWARVVKGLLDRGLRVFGYFNNHYMGHSPQSIRDFMQALNGLQKGDRQA